MSYKALDWVESLRGIHPVERIVLSVLAKRANTQDQCWPSISTIVEASAAGRRSVFRALERLQEMGLLVISSRRTESGRSRSNMYTLNLNRLTPKQGCHHDTKEGATMTPQGCHHDTLICIGIDESESSDGKSEASQGDAVHSFLTKPSESKMKAADILKSMQNAMTEQDAIAKATVGSKLSAHRLRQLWQDLHSVHKLGIYVAPMTTKESGQLSQLATKMEGTDLPRVMSAVVRDWGGFGKFCKEQGVVHDYPDQPHIGFFLKHSLLADQFQKKATAPAAPSKMLMLD